MLRYPFPFPETFRRNETHPSLTTTTVEETVELTPYALDTFRSTLGLEPWSFWQLLAPNQLSCGHLTYERNDSENHPTRTELRNAITTSLTTLRSYLGYASVPVIETTRIRLPRQPSFIRLPSCNVASLGSVVEGPRVNVLLTPLDENNDGIAEYFTATGTFVETAGARLRFFFTKDDDYRRSEIRSPEIILDSDGVSTEVIIPAYLLVRPNIYQQNPNVALNPSESAIFASSIDVAERSFVTVNEATLPDGSTTNVRLVAGEYGVIEFCDSWCWSWACDPCTPCAEVEITYLSGTFDGRYDGTIAGLAAAKLPTPFCSCSGRSAATYYQFDLAQSGGPSDYTFLGVPLSALNNPLGTRRGEVEAWRTIDGNRCVRGREA
jgi:hypothetical protein